MIEEFPRRAPLSQRPEAKPKPRESEPFINSLDPHSANYSRKTFEVRGRPDRVLRVTHFRPDAGESQKEVVQFTHEETLKMKAFFDELQDVYHIPVPIQFVIGKDRQGIITQYKVVDRIEGLNLDRPGVLSQFLAEHPSGSEREHLEQTLNAHFTSLMQYYSDKFTSREPALWDIGRIAQYIYGKKPGDTESHMYLVDVDDFLVDKRQMLSDSLSRVIESLAAIEKALHKKLAEPRQVLSRTLNELSEDDLAFVWYFSFVHHVSLYNFIDQPVDPL